MESVDILRPCNPNALSEDEPLPKPTERSIRVTESLYYTNPELRPKALVRPDFKVL
jgi:hypothetical protein